MIYETELSTLSISCAKRAPNTINFVDMRLVLVFFSNIIYFFNLCLICSMYKAFLVEGCESWENISELKGENKPSPY